MPKAVQLVRDQSGIQTHVVQLAVSEVKEGKSCEVENSKEFRPETKVGVEEVCKINGQGNLGHIMKGPKSQIIHMNFLL